MRRDGDRVSRRWESEGRDREYRDEGPERGGSLLYGNLCSWATGGSQVGPQTSLVRQSFSTPLQYLNCTHSWLSYDGTSLRPDVRTRSHFIVSGTFVVHRTVSSESYNPRLDLEQGPGIRGLVTGGGCGIGCRTEGWTPNTRVRDAYLSVRLDLTPKPLVARLRTNRLTPSSAPVGPSNPSPHSGGIGVIPLTQH